MTSDTKFEIYRIERNGSGERRAEHAGEDENGELRYIRQVKVKQTSSGTYLTNPTVVTL